MDGKEKEIMCTPLPSVRRAHVDNIEKNDLLYDIPSEIEQFISSNTQAWENVLSAIERGTLILAHPNEPITPLSVFRYPQDPPIFIEPTLTMIVDWENFNLATGRDSMVDAFRHENGSITCSAKC